MTDVTIRADLHAILDGITDIGEVHDYERWADEWPDFLDLMRTAIVIEGEKEIRGWTIGYNGYVPTHVSLGPSWESFAMAHKVKAHSFMIRGYLGIYDREESEKTASALAQLVCDTLDANSSLRDDYFYADPATLLFEARIFGGVLCHYTQIEQVVVEVI